MDQELRQLVDDPEHVPDETLLYRRIGWNHLGGKDKCPRGQEATPSGNAFRDWKLADAQAAGFAGPCMSVGVGTLLQDPVQQMLSNWQGYGLAAVEAGALRRLMRRNGTPEPQGIMLSPTDNEPWHGVVFCSNGSKKGDAVSIAISDAAFWVVPLLNDD